MSESKEKGWSKERIQAEMDAERRSRNNWNTGSLVLGGIGLLSSAAGGVGILVGLAFVTGAILCFCKFLEKNKRYNKLKAML